MTAAQGCHKHDGFCCTGDALCNAFHWAHHTAPRTPFPGQPRLIAVFLCPPATGAIKLLVEEALGVFKKEGKESLNFGISPFWNIQDDSKLPGAWWTHWGQRFLFHFGNNLYAFKNLAFSKMR
jgi:hypothetical protein